MIRISGDIVKAFVAELDLSLAQWNALEEEEQLEFLAREFGLKRVDREEAIIWQDVEEING